MAGETCEYLILQGGVASGDADISGIGVILAFVISAYVTFTLVFTSYLAGLVDPSLLGRVDRKIFSIGLSSPSPARMRIQNCLREVVVALSDQQIVTGIAIMSAGFQGLRSEISVYHFQIVLYLAWMSSSVHLSAITFLASFLRDNKGILIWRLCGMMTLFAMLVIGLVPTISNDWGIFEWDGMVPGRTGWAIRANCFWGKLYDDGVGPDAPLGFIILIFSYVWKVGSLFPAMTAAYYNRVRGPLEGTMLSILAAPAVRYRRAGRSWFWLWVYRLALGLLLPLLTMLEVGDSFAASLWLCLLSLLYGTIQIFVPRNQMLPLTGSSENSWGFGQLVPLILLVQPLGVVFDYIWSREKARPEVLNKFKPIELDHPSEHLPEHPSEKFDPYQDQQLGREAAKHRPSLLRLLTSQEPGDSVKSTSGRARVWDLLFECRLFSTLVYLVQLAILLISAAVFYFDAFTIGDTRSDNWEFIIGAMGVFMALGILLVMVTAPFSVAGRCLRRADEQAPHAGGGERPDL